MFSHMAFIADIITNINWNILKIRPDWLYILFVNSTDATIKIFVSQIPSDIRSIFDKLNKEYISSFKNEETRIDLNGSKKLAHNYLYISYVAYKY